MYRWAEVNLKREHGGEFSVSGIEGAMAQATSIALSWPRRAAAAVSTIYQGGVARRHCRATVTSRAAEKSTAGVHYMVQMGTLGAQAFTQDYFGVNAICLETCFCWTWCSSLGISTCFFLPPLATAEQKTTEAVAGSAAANILGIEVQPKQCLIYPSLIIKTSYPCYWSSEWSN